MKYLIHICRILVGSTFVVSGIIKANDPLGFSYKLEEYFAESALNLPFLEPYALALAIAACAAEVILGFAVLFGGKMKLASWSLLALTIFFAWLTAYTATCDPSGTYEVMVDGVAVEKRVTCVTDCGCFGDAMKGSLGRSLTPWESFWKDIILFVLLIPIFFMRKKIELNDWKADRFILIGALAVTGFYSWVFDWPFFITALCVGVIGHFAIKLFVKKGTEWTIAGLMAVLTGVFIWSNINGLPARDYRPYAVGNNMPELMTLPPDAPQDIYESVLTYKNSETGEVKDFNQENYPWDDSTWVWVNTESRLVQKGAEAPISDFVIMDVDGNEVTMDFMEDPGNLFIVISKNVNDFPPEAGEAIRKLGEEAFSGGAYIVGLTASPYNQTDQLRHDHQLGFDFYYGDETVLKTVVRSNPGVLLLRKGTILGKWHWKNLPPYEEIVKSGLLKIEES